jgi:hypothetical protein
MLSINVNMKYIIRSFILFLSLSTDCLSLDSDLSKKFYSNDFVITLTPLTPKIKVSNIAGFISSDTKKITPIEIQDAQKIWKSYGLNNSIKDLEPFLEQNGGLRKIFQFHSDIIGFFSVRDKSANCLTLALINLSTKKEIYRAGCTVDDVRADFNGSGGGHLEYRGDLLFAFGSLSSGVDLDDKLALEAQNIQSPFGKVLKFSAKRVKGATPYNLKKFQIYSLGHRNPQGMTLIGNKIYGIEHGPKGGDEINIIYKDKNYGWPVYSMGSKYSGEPYKPSGLSNHALPLYAFIPSIGSSDIAPCPSSLNNRYAPLTCLLVSSLSGQTIEIVIIDEKNNRAISTERIKIGIQIRQIFSQKDEELILGTKGDLIYNLSFMPIFDPKSKNIQ